MNGLARLEGGPVDDGTPVAIDVDRGFDTGGAIAAGAIDGAARAGALDCRVPGPLLFARFAFPPNRLGLCGPEAGLSLPDRVRSEVVDPDLRRIATEFEGAWPYLQLIAGENGLADPLDGRVVEAYWLGNGLLEGVGPRARQADLDRRFRDRTATREWPWLEAKAGGGSVVHHSFHVLEVLPRVGLIRGGLPAGLLGVLERCLIRPGRVVSVGPEELDVAAPPLELADGRLRLGPPRLERLPTGAAGFGDALRPGDHVALHWDRICGRLTPAAAARLSAVTARNLTEANATL